MSNCRNYFKD